MPVYGEFRPKVTTGKFSVFIVSVKTILKVKVPSFAGLDVPVSESYMTVESSVIVIF